MTTFLSPNSIADAVFLRKKNTAVCRRCCKTNSKHELYFVEITFGSVLVRHNDLLCHSGNVMWKDVLADPNAVVKLDNDTILAKSQQPQCMF